MSEIDNVSRGDAPTGLIEAFVLDGNGGGRAVGWPEIARWSPDDGALWIHLQRDHPAARTWLHRQSGLEPLIIDALLAEETRPRCQPVGDGVLLLLRGVNLNPGADPEDMVSIRVWAEATRVVSVRIRRLMAVGDIVAALAAGTGPCAPGTFVTDLAARLLERMEPAIDELGEAMDTLEDEILEAPPKAARQRLVRIRHEAIVLRRYLAPQRDAVQRLIGTLPPWIDGRQIGSLRESADRVIRYVEDLDAIRERAAVVQDELANRQADQLNTRMYLLSVVAAIMLPLGVITGLLGINVGGVPGADSPWGFAAVLVLLAAVIAVQIVLFRRLHWM